jgi:hypothetical protein
MFVYESIQAYTFMWKSASFQCYQEQETSVVLEYDGETAAC